MNRKYTEDVDNREKQIIRELYQLNALKVRALQLTESGPLIAAINRRREELLREKVELLRRAV